MQLGSFVLIIIVLSVNLFLTVDEDRLVVLWAFLNDVRIDRI